MKILSVTLVCDSLWKEIILNINALLVDVNHH